MNQPVGRPNFEFQSARLFFTGKNLLHNHEGEKRKVLTTEKPEHHQFGGHVYK